ncbi:MAG TPA: glycosyltransferase [Candidatus Polarisedimenticolia bacterium]|jgi:rhamnosyl/mannosyltransferase
MPPPSVLSIGKFYHPRSGGVEIVTRTIAEEVVRCGGRSTVACFDAELDGEETIDGVRVRRFRSRMIGPAPFSWRFLREFRRLASGHGTLVLHYPNPLAELACLAMGRGGVASMLVFYHSDLSRYNVIVDRLYWIFSRRALRRADVIVTTSPAYAAGSPVLRHLQDRVKVVPLGTDTVLFQPGPRTPDIDIPFPRRVLFVGRFARFKGLEILIRSLSSLPAEYGAVLIGDGPHGALARDLIEREGLRGRVVMPGIIPNQELPRWYRACDLLVLPSVLRSESFGVVALEAMASGLPIITTELGTGTSLYNSDGVTGRVIPPGDVRALAAAIRECYERREEMGRAARLEVEGHYSLDLFRRRMRELLHLAGTGDEPGSR